MSLVRVFLQVRVPKIISRAQEWETEHLTKGSELCKLPVQSWVKGRRNWGAALPVPWVMTLTPILSTANAHTKKVLCYHFHKGHPQSGPKEFILTAEKNATLIKSNGNCTCASGQFRALKELYPPFTHTCNFH